MNTQTLRIPKATLEGLSTFCLPEDRLDGSNAFPQLRIGGDAPDVFLANLFLTKPFRFERVGDVSVAATDRACAVLVAARDVGVDVSVDVSGLPAIPVSLLPFRETLRSLLYAAEVDSVAETELEGLEENTTPTGLLTLVSVGGLRVVVMASYLGRVVAFAGRYPDYMAICMAKTAKTKSRRNGVAMLRMHWVNKSDLSEEITVLLAVVAKGVA